MNASDRLAETIIDALERHFAYDEIRSDMRWDHDFARHLIASYIPLDKAEAEEQFAAMLESEPDSVVVEERKSTFARLRRAVHATNDMSIMCVIKAAIEKLESIQ